MHISCEIGKFVLMFLKIVFKCFDSTINQWFFQEILGFLLLYLLHSIEMQAVQWAIYNIPGNYLNRVIEQIHVSDAR